MVAPADLLQQKVGIYTPSEAALYARVHQNTLNRWLFGNNMGAPVIRPQVDDARVVTFLDFVQALAIRAIRLEHRIQLDKIRRAVDIAVTQYGVKYPLARRHTTYLAGRDLLIVPQVDADPIQVSSRSPGQVHLRPILELYMYDVGFDADHLAKEFTAFRDGDREIRMNPAIRFGEPLLSSCNYTPQALVDAVASEGGVEQAARAYGVETADVMIASRYLDHLRGVAA